MKSPTRRYSSGLRFLDSLLDGGIPVGKLLALTAPVATQSELFLYHLATSAPVQYLSTTNPDEIVVHDAIENSAVGPAIDLEFTHADPASLIDDPEHYLASMRPESFLVIDPIDGLEEAEQDQYNSFITTLKRQLRATDSIGVVHGLDTPPIPDGRRLTLKRADLVWRLEQLVLSREIKTRLLITKSRGGRAQSDPIPLSITDHIRIDTSRRIS